MKRSQFAKGRNSLWGWHWLHALQSNTNRRAKNHTRSAVAAECLEIRQVLSAVCTGGFDVDSNPTEETPTEETPTEVTPVEETPVEETPAEETPAEETPAEETPTEEIGDRGEFFIRPVRHPVMLPGDLGSHNDRDVHLDDDLDWYRPWLFECEISIEAIEFTNEMLVAIVASNRGDAESVIGIPNSPTEESSTDNSSVIEKQETPKIDDMMPSHEMILNSNAAALSDDDGRSAEDDEDKSTEDALNELFSWPDQVLEGLVA